MRVRVGAAVVASGSSGGDISRSRLGTHTSTLQLCVLFGQISDNTTTARHHRHHCLQLTMGSGTVDALMRCITALCVIGSEVVCMFMNTKDCVHGLK